MQFNTSITAVDANSYIQLWDVGPTNTQTVFSSSLLRSENVSIVFNPPLEIKNSNIAGTTQGLQLSVSSGAATLNKTTICLQGWQE